MNKTINISLNGVHFNIEENAYEVLKKYLLQLEQSFSQDEGKDEIMQDIETRIAELFKGYLGLGRDVVSEQDVSRMISVMGEPEEYLEEEATNSNESNRTIDPPKDQIEKKLYRDLDQKIIGGVLAGISHYFGWNPITVRGLYLGLPLFSAIFDIGFSFGFFTLSYIFLWIIIPAATTNIQKLQMYGAPVNVDSIKKNISKDELKETVDNVTGFTKEVVTDAAPLMESTAKGIFRIVKVILGIALIMMGIGTLVFSTVFIISSLLGTEDFFNIGNFIFEHTWQLNLFVVFIALIIVSLGIIMLYLGARLVSDQPQFKNGNAILGSSFSILFISIIGALILGVNAGLSLKDSLSYDQKDEINITSDTIDISFIQNRNNVYYFDYHRFGDVIGQTKSLDSALVEVENDLKIHKSPNDKIYLERIYTARGKNQYDAKEQIEKIDYHYKVEGNKILLDQEFYIPKTNKYKAQSVRINLYIPEGKKLITHNVDDIYGYSLEGIDRLHNYSNRSASLIINGDTLFCYDCDEIEEFSLDSEEIRIESGKGRVLINSDTVLIENDEGEKIIQITE